MMNDKSSAGSNSRDELAFRVAWLIRGFILKDLTEQEHQELDDWICMSPANQELFEEMLEANKRGEWQKLNEQLTGAGRYQSIKSKLGLAASGRRTNIRSLFPWLAAAAVLIFIIPVYWWSTNNKPKQVPGPAITAQMPGADIAPGTGRASLQLSDGSVIILDSLAQGNITKQGSVNIIKNDSQQLSYQAGQPLGANEKPAYNTLTTPRGGQYQLVLPDGSRVWLNAASSLSYPTAFTGSTRKVELTGEAYFEVAHDPAKPFIVGFSAPGQEVRQGAVEVLGTHFNIQAYGDEPLVKVSLAEGRVKVSPFKSAAVKYLSPGQQARLDTNGAVKIVRADLEADLAWKNGHFLFKEAPLTEVMKQVERWYDAQVVYDAVIKYHYNAEIPRSVPVSKLLELLQQTESVHFSIDNKKITVMK